MSDTGRSANTVVSVYNNDSAERQLASNVPSVSPFGTSTNAVLHLAVDTTTTSYINVNGQLANPRDSLTLDHCEAVVRHP